MLSHCSRLNNTLFVTASPKGVAVSVATTEREIYQKKTKIKEGKNLKQVDVSIVLAAYNEEKAIADELEIIKKAMDSSKYSYEVIVVDDASTDNTAKIVGKYPRVRLFERPINLGTGASRKYGTLQAKGKYVVWSDADLTYPNHQIPELVKVLDESEQYDQVVGARTSEQGHTKILRVPAKWCIRKLAIFLTGSDIPDLNSGLRVFRRDVALKYLYLLPRGFSCVTTMTLSFLINNHPVKYFPIEYKKRVGVSKFRPIHDTVRYLTQVIRMVMYFNPLKIFLPVAAALLFIGVGKLFYDIIARGFSITGSTIVALMVAFQVLVIGLLADLIVGMSRKE